MNNTVEIIKSDEKAAKKEWSVKKKKRVIAFLYILSFLVSVAPICAYVLVNKDRYVTGISDGVKLCAGGIIALILVGMKTLGKLKISSRTTFFALCGLLGYLLESIICDICVLCMLALLGEVADFIVGIPKKRLKESLSSDIAAEKTAAKIEEVISKYYRGS